jgi:hypothetical protein
MAHKDTTPYYLVHALGCLAIALVAPFIGCGEEVGIALDETPVASFDADSVDDQLGEAYSEADGLKPESGGDSAIVCDRDIDCAGLGGWTECAHSRCRVRATERTLRVDSFEFSEPQELGLSLGGSLNDLVTAGELNLLVYLGQTDSWLIQGITSGSVDGQATYGQSSRFGSYCGTSEIHCSDGLCSTQFQPQSNGERLSLYVRDRDGVDDDTVCGYQTLELLDVSIGVQVDLRAGEQTDQHGLSARVVISGVLPEAIAHNFTMGDGDHLIDILRRQGMEMNSRTVDGLENGWRIEMVGTGNEVVFDNDPGQGFATQPAEPTRGSMSQERSCRP